MFFFNPPDVEKLLKKRDINKLVKALRHKDNGTRESAAIALGKLGDQKAVEPLIEMLVKDNNIDRRKVSMALKHLDPPAADNLIYMLKNGDSRERKIAAETLGFIGKVAAVEPLVAALSDNFVREKAAEALIRINSPRAIEPLIKLLKDQYDEVRVIAAKILVDINNVEAVEPLIEQLNSHNHLVRENATKSLVKIGDLRAVEPLIPLLNDANEQTRLAVIQAFGQFKDTRAITPLINLLIDSNNAFSKEILKSLEMIGEPAISAIGIQLHRLNPTLCQEAIEILDRYGWKPSNDKSGITYWYMKRHWNVIIEMGLEGQDYLLNALRDKNNNRDIRISIVSALCDIGDIRIVDHINELLLNELFPHNRYDWLSPESLRLVEILEKRKDPKAIDPLLSLMDKLYTYQDRARIVKALSVFNDQKLISIYLNIIESEREHDFGDTSLRDSAFYALAQSKTYNKLVADEMRNQIANHYGFIGPTGHIIYYLGEVRDILSVPVLLEFLKGRKGIAWKKMALWALEEIIFERAQEFENNDLYDIVKFEDEIETADTFEEKGEPGDSYWGPVEIKHLCTIKLKEQAQKELSRRGLY